MFEHYVFALQPRTAQPAPFPVNHSETVSSRMLRQISQNLTCQDVAPLRSLVPHDAIEQQVDRFPVVYAQQRILTCCPPRKGSARLSEKNVGS